LTLFSSLIRPADNGAFNPADYGVFYSFDIGAPDKI
jgi:hypothetical protein